MTSDERAKLLAATECLMPDRPLVDREAFTLALEAAICEYAEARRLQGYEQGFVDGFHARLGAAIAYEHVPVKTRVQ